MPDAAVLYAERYAAMGWPVLPVQPRGKRPLNGQGIDHATTDVDRIRSWFKASPQANIGIRLDAARLLAVDIDPRNGGGLELADELPATLTANTGGGGLHLLYRAQEGLQAPGKLRQGVDIKHRGFIVCEPSVHPCGRAYAWRGWDVLGDASPDIAEAPADMFSMPAGDDAAQAEPSDDRITAGGRNEFLSREAFKLRKSGLSVPEVTAVLRLKNLERCAPPLAEAEVHAIAAGKARVRVDGVKLEHLLAHMPSHQYLFVPTRELWPGSSVNGRVSWPVVNGKKIAPTSWLDRHRPIEQMVWHPAEPEIIRDRVMQVSGWVPHVGATVFNLYRPPNPPHGSADRAGPWCEHVRFVYPDDHEHVIAWLAHLVQRRGVKCNHALVLGGAQGIGKDTLLEPLKAAVGPWNCSDISPSQMLGRFNGWLKAVLIRISEARDLGDVDRFAFYDHSKTIIAAPPDVLRVDEKHLRETYVANVCGVIITTNHATDGLYLPADDRRHYIAWSPRKRDDFDAIYWTRLYRWFHDEGGIGHVCAYLAQLDISLFDPKVPPPKTAAFWSIVAAGDAPEAGEMRDVIDSLGNPDALTLQHIVDHADSLHMFAFADELKDRKSRRSLPHKFERAGYAPVRNPDSDDGLFRVRGRRQVVYARRALPLAEQVRAARKLP